MTLSIITITYNNLAGLQKTANSVFCQTYQDFEWIVVDGGSTDGSVEQIVQYADRCQKQKLSYRYRSERDKGVYDAMNKGVSMATGMYCQFLNAGDCLADNLVLEKCFEENNPHDILIGKARTTTRIIPPPNKISIRFFYYHGSINHQAAFIRRRLLEKYPYKVEQHFISADYRFFIQTLLLEGCTYRPIDVMVVDFDANGISSQPYALAQIRREQRESLREFLNEAELRDMETLQYEDYTMVRWAKWCTKCLVNIRHATRLKTYDNCMSVQQHPTKSLLFRRMLRTFWHRCKAYAQVERMVKTKAIADTTRTIPIVISLTSYPARHKTICQTLHSLMTQTIKPDKIILWLTSQQYPAREANLPTEVLDLRQYGLQIAWCDYPMRSYTKLVPTLRTLPNAIIVTADDDILYRRDWLEGLYKAYIKQPKHIHCYCAHRIKWNHNGTLLPYNEWGRVDNGSVSFANLLMGVGGVLYPPNSLYKDVDKEELFMSCAPQADDLWFWAMATLNGYKVEVHKGKHSSTIPVPGVNNASALFNENAMGANDEQMQQIIDRYPMLMNILKEHTI